ncbi:MAG: polysaccharide deacetylase family protein [Cellulosilyticaceae bacterium]
MKKEVGIVVMLMMCFLGSTVYAKEMDVSVIFNDEMVVFETGEAVQKGYVNYVPAREMGEYLGVQVIWNGTTSLSKEGVGQFEVPPHNIYVDNQTTYVPIKYFSWYFGYQLSVNNTGDLIRVREVDGAHLTDEEVFEKYKKQPKVTKQQVYLTFDDGPNVHTSEILDLLKQYDMKATFFMIDGQMKKYPEVVKRIVNEGHGVALHGVTHDKNQFYKTAQSPLFEMNQANATLKSLTGSTTKLVRMPYGSVPYLTNAQYNALKTAGYCVWDWDVDSRDWANRNGQKSYDSVITQLTKQSGDGEVILFHDSKETVKSTKLLLEWCAKNNYETKNLSDTMTPYTFKK